jgi:hypothetical protein
MEEALRLQPPVIFAAWKTRHQTTPGNTSSRSTLLLAGAVLSSGKGTVRCAQMSVASAPIFDVRLRNRDGENPKDLIGPLHRFAGCM